MNKKIFLLTDYRNQFYFSTKYRGACVDVLLLKDYFLKSGYELIIRKFTDLDLRNENFKDQYILYQSSEDPNLFYKDYIEDIIYGLKLQGAKLIPDFKYFRAHHNKVFMEILRDILEINELKSIHSRYFGTFEEYNDSNPTKGLLFKPGYGTRSKGVEILDTDSKLIKVPFKLSRSFTLDNFKLLVSKIKTGKPFTPISNNRRKFITQNFISNLNGDYRILVYGKKLYFVYRENRKNDFRASGSGKLDFDATPPEGMLNYAEKIYEQFNTPYMSLDIGYLNNKFYLFEFQCLCLGQYTLEKSKFYYSKNEDESWSKKFEDPILEREIVETIVKHINK